MNPIINQMHAHRSFRAYTGEAMLAMMQEYDEHMAAYYERRGASGRRWIGQMEHFFAKPRRTGDRSFYESQGASLE